MRTPIKSMTHQKQPAEYNFLGIPITNFGGLRFLVASSAAIALGLLYVVLKNYGRREMLVLTVFVTSPNVSFFIKNSPGDQIKFLEIVFVGALVSAIGGLLTQTGRLRIILNNFKNLSIYVNISRWITNRPIEIAIVVFCILLALLSLTILVINPDSRELLNIFFRLLIVGAIVTWMMKAAIYPAQQDSQILASRNFLIFNAYLSIIFLSVQILRIQLHLRYVFVAVIVALSLKIYSINRYQTVAVVSAVIGLTCSGALIFFTGSGTFLVLLGSELFMYVFAATQIISLLRGTLLFLQRDGINHRINHARKL